MHFSPSVSSQGSAGDVYYGFLHNLWRYKHAKASVRSTATFSLKSKCLRAFGYNSKVQLLHPKATVFVQYDVAKDVLGTKCIKGSSIM
jgi:hypothetical protein